MAMHHTSNVDFLWVRVPSDAPKCELYAMLKTWHLLVSSFRLINNTTSIIDRGLELHKRDFPMFHRYKIVLFQHWCKDRRSV